MDGSTFNVIRISQLSTSTHSLLSLSLSFFSHSPTLWHIYTYLGRPLYPDAFATRQMFSFSLTFVHIHTQMVFLSLSFSLTQTVSTPFYVRQIFRNDFYLKVSRKIFTFCRLSLAQHRNTDRSLFHFLSQFRLRCELWRLWRSIECRHAFLGGQQSIQSSQRILTLVSKKGL